MIAKKAGFVGIFCSLAFVSYASAGLPLEKELTLRLPAEGLRTLRIDAGAGSLRVVGDASLSEVLVTARLVVRGIRESRLDDFMADEVRFSLEKRGESAVLVGKVDSRFRIFNLGREAYLDLTVRTPKSLDLDIDDSSGSVEVESMDGNLKLVDGSGSVDIRDIGGDVEVEDGSGGISIRGVGGNVTVDDGSGEVEIFDVQGNVVVDDGSGSIQIDRVEKDVRIEREGSGSVHIDRVKGRIIR
jgi:hypothetical protein